MTVAEPQDTQSKLRKTVPGSVGRKQVVYPALFFVAVIAAWTGIVRLLQLPTYLLPTPYEIVMSFEGQLGLMWPHIRITLFEAFFGWVVGNIVGITLGLLMSESRALRTALYPYLIGFRSVPVIVLAPLLILWLGLNITPILATATITVFFPMLVNAIAGFNSTDQLSEELMRSLDASRWQVFRKVKLYNAAPYIFSAMKIGVALSLIGAIVGEWLVADEGIGFLIVIANNQVNTLLMFRGIIVISLMGSIWFAILAVTERYVIYWQDHGSQGGL